LPASGRGTGRSAIAMSAQMLPEELGGPAPGQFRRLAVMYRHPLLVNKGMFGVIAEQLQRLAGSLHALFEAVDQGRRAPIILVGEMRLQRNLDVGGLGRLLWRNAIEHDAGSQLGDLGGADNGHRATEAETGQADLWAAAGK